MADTDHALSPRASDEVLALSSIYGDAFEPLDGAGSRFRITLALDLDAALHPTLAVTLPPAYPATCPPTMRPLMCPRWSDDMVARAAAALDDLWRRSGTCTHRAGHDGCDHDVVLFEWIEWVRQDCEETLRAMGLGESAEDGSSSVSSTMPPPSQPPPPPGSETVSDPSEVRDLPDLSATAPWPLASHADPIVDRKSVFVAHACRITSAADPPALWRYLLQHRRIARATHNITAWRLTLPDGVAMGDCDDDGEDAAGKRLLHLLHATGATNVWVCVSRWYGGVQLGPARFAHINHAARLALVNLGVIPEGGGGGSGSGSHPSKSK